VAGLKWLNCFIPFKPAILRKKNASLVRAQCGIFFLNPSQSRLLPEAGKSCKVFNNYQL
jgi:hypothetical protein